MRDASMHKGHEPSRVVWETISSSDVAATRTGPDVYRCAPAHLIAAASQVYADTHTHMCRMHLRKHTHEKMRNDQIDQCCKHHAHYQY